MLCAAVASIRTSIPMIFPTNFGVMGCDALSDMFEISRVIDSGIGHMLSIFEEPKFGGGVLIERFALLKIDR